MTFDLKINPILGYNFPYSLNKNLGSLKISTCVFFTPLDSRRYPQKSTTQDHDNHIMVLNASSPKFSMLVSKLIYKYRMKFPWKTKTSW